MSTSFAQKLIDAQLVYSTAFAEGVESLREGVEIVWPQKARLISAPGTEETVFGFLTELPLFRKWVGERQKKRLNTGSYSVKVEDYEFSYLVHKNDIKYDRNGVIAMHMSAAGVAQRRFPEKLINDLQAAGKTTLCHDGQYFYDTDHPNSLNGSGSTFQNVWTSMDLTPANLATRYTYMTQLKDANGVKLGIRPTILEYGPDLMVKARTALEAEFIAQAITNVAGSENVAAAGVSNVGVRGLLQPLLNPELETGVWYLHDTRMIKPFLYIEETAPTGLMSRVDLTDPQVWDHQQFEFGSNATAAAAYTLPQLSSRQEV